MRYNNNNSNNKKATNKNKRKITKVKPNKKERKTDT